uniref:PET domain-containing protein n=1 Tax=Lynx canadensis TaxID=61383 RepID=A0A667GFH7_LYNCA
MDLEAKVKKMGLGHEQGFGAPCLKCKEKCEGFELHFWRKICRNCKCGQEEHDVLLSNEEDRKVGKLFEDTKYTTLIAKLKTDGIPMYQRNVMILTIQLLPRRTSRSIQLPTSGLLLSRIRHWPGNTCRCCRRRSSPWQAQRGHSTERSSWQSSSLHTIKTLQSAMSCLPKR